ncbi:MAG: TadE/TadG family type IV pilus assembly protein [Acetobacteraceae bacterium]
MILSLLRAARRGETALEFAIVGGLFVLMLLAPVEAGLMVWTASALQVAATAAARCDGIGACTNPQAFAAQVANSWIGSGVVSAANVTVANTTSCNKASGQFVTVTVKASVWTGAMLSPLFVPSQSATACFPL